MNALKDCKPEQKILDIERLRGIAILLVLIQHSYLGPMVFIKCRLDWLRMPFWIGVELFFVISGFVVTKSFLSHQMSFRRFYLRRVFRLWPVVFIFSGLCLLVNLFPTVSKTDWPVLFHLIPSVFFGYFNLQSGRSHYFGAMWSLSVEEQFYLVMPTLLFVLSKCSRNAAGVCQRSFVAVYLVLAVARFGSAFGGPSQVPEWMQFLLTWKFDFLILGVILYYQMGHTYKALESRTRWSKVLIVGGLLVPLLVTYRLGAGLDSFQQAPILHSFGMLFMGLSFCMVVALAAQNNNLLYTNQVMDPCLLYFGSRSYGIYALHFPIFALFQYPLQPWLPRLGGYYGLIQAASFLLLGLPIIELTYRWIERPGIAVGGRVIRRLLPSTIVTLQPSAALNRAA